MSEENDTPSPDTTDDDVQAGPDLSQLRVAIESIDQALLEGLRERMKLSESIASAKIRAAAPFRDQTRAEQVIERIRRLAAEMELDPHQMEHLYRLIMEMSISHQQAYLEQLEDTPLRVAYQGVEGSFSHLTAQRRYGGRVGGVVLNGYETFRGAAESVKLGVNDVALLPIENSTAGSINETYDLLTEGGLAMNAEEISEVSHCLLGLRGAKRETLHTVLSHPQALAQCEQFLADMPWAKAVTEFDTAGAARRVKESNDVGLGAIASQSAAGVFGLEIIAADIQNVRANYTRFVELAVESVTCAPEQPCKTSLLLATGHRPGDLGQVLLEFAKRSVNLTKLESRPVPGAAWRYRFYLDLDGHARSSAITEALEAIEPHTVELRILGTYPKARQPEAASESDVTGNSSETP